MKEVALEPEMRVMELELAASEEAEATLYHLELEGAVQKAHEERDSPMRALASWQCSRVMQRERTPETLARA